MTQHSPLMDICVCVCVYLCVCVCVCVYLCVYVRVYPPTTRPLSSSDALFVYLHPPPSISVPYPRTPQLALCGSGDHPFVVLSSSVNVSRILFTIRVFLTVLSPLYSLDWTSLLTHPRSWPQPLQTLSSCAYRCVRTREVRLRYSQHGISFEREFCILFTFFLCGKFCIYVILVHFLCNEQCCTPVWAYEPLPPPPPPPLR